MFPRLPDSPEQLGVAPLVRVRLEHRFAVRPLHVVVRRAPRQPEDRVGVIGLGRRVLAGLEPEEAAAAAEPAEEVLGVARWP